MRRNANSESGIALIMVLGVLAVLLILAVTFAFNMRLEQRAARNYLDYVSADYFAKAGIERAIAELLAQRGAGYFDGMGVLTETITTSDNIDIGEFSVSITDESGKLNLNHTGNLADNGASPFHGANEGWTTYEISIEDVMFALGVDYPGNTPEHIARLTAEEIVEYRYGGPDAGGDPVNHSYNDGFDDDGIDNDGSGNAGSTGSNDPLWFTPWKPRAGHQPFVAASQLYRVAVDNDWDDEWEQNFWPDVSGHVTAHSRAGNTFFDGANLRNMLNINAVYSAEALYEHLDGLGLPAAEARDLAQKAVNIIDYRDKNDWVTEFEYDAATGESVYGVESILINEVLAYSYDFAIGETVTTVDGAGSGGFVIDALPGELVFRLKINLELIGDFDGVTEANVEMTVSGDEPAYDRIYGVGYTVAGEDVWYSYHDEPVKSSAAGVLDFGMSVTLTLEDPLEPAPEFTLTVTSVELVCAEFIELVNIGGDDINVSGWEIEVDGVRAAIPAVGDMGSGDYLVLTNDEDLFERSYGGTFNTVEITDWNSWDPAWTPADVPSVFEDITNFPNNGNFDIYLYIEYTDSANYLLADLSINGTHIAQPGSSSGIGVSREKNDPAIRDDWDDNVAGSATPGEDNSRVDYGVTEDILAGLRGDGGLYHPPLVENKHFATVGELFRTYDWRPGQENNVKYAGVRSHVSARSWLGLGAHLTPADAARRLIAGYYIRVDQNPDTVRLDRNHGRMSYNVYSFHTEDEEEGEFVEELEADDINSDGDVPYTIQPDEYLLLIPDSIPGRVNINTASASVLRGLPGMRDFPADDIASASAFANLGAFYNWLEAHLGGEIPAKRHFAPIANLITVDSDVFRIESTGVAIGPQGDSATKTIEAIVDRSGGSVRILSWKVQD